MRGGSLHSGLYGGGYTSTTSESIDRRPFPPISAHSWHSWDNIRQTIHMTDAELNARFRGTALYVALQSTMLAPHAPAGFVSSPAEAQVIPDPDELALRWPGMSPDDVEAVYRDYRKESEYLAELRLDDMYRSLRDLVAEDAGAV